MRVGKAERRWKDFSPISHRENLHITFVFRLVITHQSIVVAERAHIFLIEEEARHQ
jgi:hypothetical protein